MAYFVHAVPGRHWKEKLDQVCGPGCEGFNGTPPVPHIVVSCHCGKELVISSRHVSIQVPKEGSNSWEIWGDDPKYSNKASPFYPGGEFLGRR